MTCVLLPLSYCPATSLTVGGRAANEEEEEEEEEVVVEEEMLVVSSWSVCVSSMKC